MANPKIWSMADLAVGSTVEYELYNDSGKQRRIFRNFLDAKAGDAVIGYESTPVKQIVALAEVSKRAEWRDYRVREERSFEESDRFSDHQSR